MILAVVLVIPGLMFTASCAKKEIRPESAMYQDKPRTRQSASSMTTTSEKDRLAREQALIDESARQEKFRREEEGRLAGVSERTGADTRISQRAFMSEDVYFSYDSAALSSNAQDALRRKAEWMQNHPNVSVIIEGHCDERGTNAYNMALGDRRAESAKAFLVNLGIPRSRMTTISYGEESPAVPSHNESAWARNRRAHFVTE